MTEQIAIDRYLVETLMPDLVGHDRKPAAFVVYLWLAVRAADERREGVEASLQTIADETGLSKSAVQSALRALARRQLVRSERAHATATPVHAPLRPWLRRSREAARRGERESAR